MDTDDGRRGGVGGAKWLKSVRDNVAGGSVRLGAAYELAGREGSVGGPVGRGGGGGALPLAVGALPLAVDKGRGGGGGTALYRWLVGLD